MKNIINSILQRFKEGALARRTGLSNRTVAYKGLEEIETCLVLWQATSEPSSWVEELKKRMPGVKLDKLCFVPAEAELLTTNDVVTFREEELGFGGRILNDRLLAVLAHKYDLLLDFTSVSNVMIQYVLTNSQAHCIVGMKKAGGKADIIVDGVKGPLEFIDGLIKVLAEINKY